MLNLLNNAAKYTPEGGHIRLAVEQAEPARRVIRVRDNGMGIPADLLPKIFDLFAQGDRSLDRSEGGLGIGLTLVRKLVEMHGGSVEAHSAGRRPGERVRRPPAASRGGAVPGRLTRPGPGELRGHQLPPPACAGGRRQPGCGGEHGPLLQMWGHDVQIAHDGPSALARAAEYRPDVVLLDIGLPGMSGYEVARKLRELPGPGRPVLVAVTGYGQQSDRRRTREAGFDHHLVKPVEAGQLQEILTAAPVGG